MHTFFTRSWSFLISNKQEQLEFILEEIIGMYIEICRKSQTRLFCTIFVKTMVNSLFHLQRFKRLIQILKLIYAKLIQDDIPLNKIKYRDKQKFSSRMQACGNTGCGVFKRGVQNQNFFCLRINILIGFYRILRIGLMGRCQKVQNHPTS